MSDKTTLEKALNAISHAKIVLKHAQNTVSDYQDINRALKELDTAESYIKSSIKELE